jgi:hypothetical protein
VRRRELGLVNGRAFPVLIRFRGQTDLDERVSLKLPNKVRPMLSSASRAFVQRKWP